jgi:hypothetical protein
MTTNKSHDEPSKNIKTHEPEITREEVRRAALQVTEAEYGEETLPKAAFAAIYEAAFAAPVAGLKYENEVDDLANWIVKSMGRDDDIDMRLLALPFEYIHIRQVARGDIVGTPTLIREATLDFVRAVAIYRLRTEAYIAASADKEEAERLAAPKAGAQ